jgi:hypothetical protein
MAKGENAQHHCSREYWSRRHPGMLSWGRVGKQLTHRRERAARRRDEHKAERDADTMPESADT